MADVVVDSENKNSKELYGQGVRAYVLQDYSSAVTALGKASELLVLEHGDDLHESLGEVYLYYGKALLGVSREEAEALGDAVPRNNEDSSEEDNVEGSEENCENEETSENDENEAKESDKKADNDEESGTEKPADGSGEGTSTNGTNKDDVTDNGTATAETEDEPSDLQLAWEVLELAKTIFLKQGDSAKRNLAETLTVLGEVSLESENFEAAVNDISEGLKMQKEIFGKDSRTVAETYYKLGVAYSTNTQIDEAIDSFNSSLEYLNNRIASLEKSENKKDEAEEEIKELKNLIPDIQEKVTDMKTYKDEALKGIVSAMMEEKKPEAPAASSSTSKPATNISHLVKRKRKAEDMEDKQSVQEENPPKKANQ